MYYVTARDGDRTAFLLGPFDSNEEAVQWVDAGRKLACDADSRAWFYSFGTTRYLGSEREGVLNHRMTTCSWNAGGDPVAGCDAWAVRDDLCGAHLAVAARLEASDV